MRPKAAPASSLSNVSGKEATGKQGKVLFAKPELEPDGRTHSTCKVELNPISVQSVPNAKCSDLNP